MGLQSLSSKEDQVFTLWQAGKTNKEIAAAMNISEETVRSQKRHIKKKNKNVHVLAYQKPLRAEPAQIQKSDLPDVLSTVELEVFLEMEKSQKTYQAIAKTIKTTPETVKTAVQRIKEKVGPDFRRLFEKKADTAHELQQCENCLRYMGTIHNNGSKTIACQIHRQVTYKNDEPCFCQNYKRYTENKFHEKDLLEEKLNDKGFLKMAFDRYALDQEPVNPADMLKLSVNSIENSDYILKKRAESLKTLIFGARYKIVLLTASDLNRHAYSEEYFDEETGETKKRTRYPIKEYMASHRIKSAKTEYHTEAGKEITTHYFIVKKPATFSVLTNVLAQDVTAENRV